MVNHKFFSNLSDPMFLTIACNVIDCGALWCFLFVVHALQFLTINV